MRAVTRYTALKLGWATTVHSSQGASINTEVDINPEGFTKESEGTPWKPSPGIGYTAVSRATDIRLVRFLKRPKPSMFVTDPRVRAYHARIMA